MNKTETLEHVKTLLSQGEITKQELSAIIETIEQGTVQIPGGQKQKMNLSQVLYYIGGAIVVMGVAVLIGQNWDKLNSFTRVLASLGVSIASYITAVLLSQREHTSKPAQAFFFISGILLPVGLAVLFYQTGYQLSSITTQTAIVGISFATLIASFLLLRRMIMLIFSVLFGTFFYFISTSAMASGSPWIYEFHFTEYRFLLAGIALALLGFGLSKGQFNKLRGILYSLGTIGFLSAALSLGGFKPSQNLLWEILFPGLVFGILFLSVFLKSKSMLTFASLFLMGFIVKITYEYFTDSLGWPLALVIIGFMLIGIGYGTVFINKKYFTKLPSITLPTA